MKKILTSNAGLELIKKFEGYRANVYKCLAGYKTIGYGHKLKKHENLKFISKDEALILLYKDILIVEKAVIRNIILPLTPGQFDALVSFTFNVGPAALQRSTLRQKINGQYFDEIEEEFMRWIYVGVKRAKGLLIRRRAEVELFFS